MSFFNGKKRRLNIIRCFRRHRMKARNKQKNRNLLQNYQTKDTGKRTFFSASRPAASLSVEAALAVPLFLVFVTGMISFLMIFSVQLDIRDGLEETVRSLGRKAYMAARTETDIPLLAPASVTLALHKGERKERLDRSGIVGGVSGINPLFSEYDPETGILDAAVGYLYKIPVLPEKVSEIYLEQRVRTHAWTGRKLDTAGQAAEGEKETEEEQHTVYVTENGSVYHTSKDCHYLDLSIRQVSYAEVESLRNQSGSRYGTCPLCARYAASGGTVYVTDYGENWHARLDCSGLKRTVMKKDISEIGDLPLCSKCGKKH